MFRQRLFMRDLGIEQRGLCLQRVGIRNLAQRRLAQHLLHQAAHGGQPVGRARQQAVYPQQLGIGFGDALDHLFAGAAQVLGSGDHVTRRAVEFGGVVAVVVEVPAQRSFGAVGAALQRSTELDLLRGAPDHGDTDAGAQPRTRLQPPLLCRLHQQLCDAHLRIARQHARQQRLQALCLAGWRQAACFLGGLCLHGHRRNRCAQHQK